MREYKVLKRWAVRSTYYDLIFWPKKWGLYARKRNGEWFICLGPFLLLVSPFPF